MRHTKKILVTALAVGAALAVAIPAGAASGAPADRPLTRSELKKTLLTSKDLGKGWGVLRETREPVELAGLDVDDHACLSAARKFDAAFDSPGQGVLILGPLSGTERVYTGGSAALKRMTAAAQRVAAACDGAGDTRDMLKITRRSPGALGDVAHGFEIRTERPPYNGADNVLLHVGYVVVRYRSAVAVIEGLDADGKSHWNDTLKLARKAVAKLKSAYPKRA
ncbi:hypothetical protein [Microtetraspora niveoalba]|uniref:hypothetical protein n=1 Tax=Microtetraspora niveoalba TaxID=46175 RepID=UPI000835A3CD|nr:hypothetical protein [Microtetraspora niveoalba]